MTTLVLASFGTTVITILLVFVSVLLIGLVLIQKNRGAGLSGAFGGVGGHTAFGTKTGDFLTWITVGFTALFMLLSIAGNYVFEPGKPSPRPTPAAVPAPTDQAPQTGGGAVPEPVSPENLPQALPVTSDPGAAGQAPLTPPPAALPVESPASESPNDE